MYSCDTNILLYYLDELCSENKKASLYLDRMKENKDFVLCDLVLVELFILLQNNKVLRRPYSAKGAREVCLNFRSNPNWKILEYSSGTMDLVWEVASSLDSKPHRIFDLRLGFCLYRSGVTHFATRNKKDFKAIGFEELVNPID